MKNDNCEQFLTLQERPEDFRGYNVVQFGVSYFRHCLQCDQCGHLDLN